MREGQPTPIPLDELLRHAIKMRAVHRAVGYDVTRESEWISSLRRQLRDSADTRVITSPCDADPR